ncbi:Phytoene synthase [Granulicella sibirica]|uniref:Phytoene synthase n=1 Tax=Granulicella sibirica TaxID=2479048 RepID=A0A4V1L5F3_9BACT|nr:Phytoene synthase [Granulicella sibirica]
MDEAYAACRVIARREAKNFYYAFRVLPKHKSDAMCAVYAFMRKADDLSDDESMSLEARRAAMAGWLEDWRAARVGGPTNDPVFLAVSDAQKRFAISDELLEDLVRGTCMDLEETQAGTTVLEDASLGASGPKSFQVYEDFDKLYRYCYLVASVVGLVCIKVFGYSDARAEKLAEETGVAFQLTNILRDVKEDAERGRVYLPLEDMRRAQVGLGSILTSVMGRGKPACVGPLMELEADRARAYYGSADRLLPMIDRDGRAALWVMVTIYRELLEKITANGYSVTERTRVSTLRKLTILVQGTAMAVWFRVTA